MPTGPMFTQHFIIGLVDLGVSSDFSSGWRQDDVISGCGSEGYSIDPRLKQGLRFVTPTPPRLTKIREVANQVLFYYLYILKALLLTLLLTFPIVL